jgi:hypothetical protein
MDGWMVVASEGGRTGLRRSAPGLVLIIPLERPISFLPLLKAPPLSYERCLILLALSLDQ